MRDQDPFERARAAQRKTLLRTFAIAGVVGCLVAGILLTVHFTRAARPVLPAEVVSGLRRTSFDEPVDPRTGWRRLVSAIPPGVVVAAAAVGRDGTFAMAFSRSGDVGDRVLAWRDGHWSAAHDTASDVTALAVSPEGDTWIGTLQGGILVMRRDGNVVPSAQRTSGTSISQFAFDPASGKTAVLLSSGEVYTALRGLTASDVALRPGVLAPVTLPPHARSRHALYDADGDLVLAGDAGAVFVATSSGWDDRTIAAGGDVAAIGLDAEGTLIAAQSTGHVWRWSGATWAAAGHVPHPPLAIGELPVGGGRGLVVATDDGQLFAVTSESDGALAPGYAATVDEPVFAAQIAGANVVYVSTHRVRIWASAMGRRAATWDSAADSVRGRGTACLRAAPALVAEAADRVACGHEHFRVTTSGLAPEDRPALATAATPVPAAVQDPRALLVAACAGSLAPPCDLIPTASFRADSAVPLGDAAWVASYTVSRPAGVLPDLMGEPSQTWAPAGDLLVRVHTDATPRPPGQPTGLRAETLAAPAPPVAREFVGPGTRVVAWGDRALVLRAGVVATVGADDTARPFVLPAPGLVPVALWRDEGAVAVAPHGDLALLVDQGSARRILRCHAESCALVEGVPRDDAPTSVGFTADDHLYVVTADHDLAVQTR